MAPFGELADPRILAGLAVAAEERGWDGFFVWDHIVYRAPVRAVANPRVALAAVSCATSSLRIGPLVSPLARRRVHKVARETVTLDLLSSRGNFQAIANVSRLVGPGGTLLAIAAVHDDNTPPATLPPWPLRRAEIEAFGTDGLSPARIEITVIPGEPDEHR